MDRLGVVIVGLSGAVSSTMVAGIQLMAKGAVPKVGMLTERLEESRTVADKLTFVGLENMVFGGWDLNDESLYESSLRHGVFREDQLAPVKESLSAVRPWKAVFSQQYAKNLDGKHVVVAASFREQIAAIKADIEAFKQANGLEHVVMANIASTERYVDVQPVHETLEAFEKGLDDNDPAITPTMRYFYAANSLGVSHLNFAPTLANVPALRVHAEKHGVPYAGMDGKTGQTLVKTALASMFRARRLRIAGWYSVNFLGNSDGLVLNDPASNETKVRSKQSVLDSIVGHKVDNHQVHIHYYKPRGDAKEAWDNIDVVGFAGVPMQMKVNFLCQDSILAAPLIVDVIRFLDVAKRNGEKGVQQPLSMYFKSPYTAGEEPEHDLFKQEAMLEEWINRVAAKSS